MNALFPPRRLGRLLLDLIYPPRCLVCLASAPSEGDGFCARCEQEIVHDPEECCPRCAATVGPYAVHDGRCGDCRREALHFDAAVRLGLYKGALGEAILRIKSVRNEVLAERLARGLARERRSRLLALGVDAVVPVPLHWSRRLWRGYNQSEVLARELAEELGLPCRSRWLYRTRRTQEQKRIRSRDERQQNVRGAFQTRQRLDGLHLLLIDDMMTTGETANAAAGALKKAGAIRVSVAVLARTQR